MSSIQAPLLVMLVFGAFVMLASRGEKTIEFQVTTWNVQVENNK